jgi:uncharacterized protein with beta-barrel porin domain
MQSGVDRGSRGVSVSVRPTSTVRQLAVVSIVLGGLGGALMPAAQALPNCSPATGDNVTVTCTGTTQDQGPGTNTGYGASNQNGVTVNVQSGASVLGTSIGIDLNANNTINNLGTITTNGVGIGNVWGINTNGALTVTNSGTIGRVDILNPSNSDLAGINTNGTGLVVTNTNIGVIQGLTAISGGGTPSVMTVTNSGLINALVGGGGTGIFADTLTLTNNPGATITADASAVQANTATISNYSTISAPPPPAGAGGGAALNVNALTLVNYASGVITGDGAGIQGSSTPVYMITNFGNISGTGLGAPGIQGNAVTLVNSGTVSGGPSGSAISTDHGAITNNMGGTVTGGIVAFHNTTIFNAGTITQSGGPAISFTSVSGGGGGNTLTIAPTSAISGNVVASGADTFQLGGPGTGTFDLGLIGTQYQGFATFNKVDASTWTLTGTGNQAWTVQAGTLLVNGNLAAASGITVNPGGTLGGTGTLPTTNVNGGVLVPGSATGVGAVTVSGNLNFQAGSTYLVRLSPSTASTANVSGTAALAGTVLAAPQPGNLQRSYTILTAHGGFGGSTFNNLAFTASGLAGSLSYTPTTVVLGLTAQLGLNGTFSQNQQNVANAINTFFNNGGALPPGFANVFNLTGANLGTALSQLSGEAATGSQQSAFQLMDEFLSFMLDPFVDGGGDTGGANGKPMSFAAEAPALPPEVALAYNAVLKAPPRTFEQRWSVRGAAYGGYGRINGDPFGLGTHDLSARTGGFAGALDYHLSRDTVIGVALAGGETSWGLANGLGGGRGDALQAGVYAATRDGPAYLAGSAAYTWHAEHTDRFAVGDELTARFDAQSFGGRVEGGYRLAWPMVATVTPYAAVQAQSFFTPSYSETDTGGGGFGLAFASRTATDTRTELGARFDRVVAINQTSVLDLKTRLAWAHDWVSDPMLAAAFELLPGAGLVVNGAVPAKNSALATAGAELRLVNGVSLRGKFDAQLASHAGTYAGTGVLRYVW